MGIWGEVRGLFIGGVFYVIGPNTIGSYAAGGEAFLRIDSLHVDEGAGAVNRWNYTMTGEASQPEAMPGDLPPLEDLPPEDLPPPEV